MKRPKIRFKGFDDAWEQRKFASVFEGLQNNTLSRAELNYESGTVRKKNRYKEGSVNKLKVTKRIMYGRNSFELLKGKMLRLELKRKLN